MGTWLCLAGPVSTLRQLPRQWPGPRDARRPRLLVVASSVGQGTMQLLYQVSAMGRPALVSSPGPVFSSTRTMTSSAPALSYQMTPPTTIMWPLGRLSLLPINSGVWGRLTCLKSELENTMLLVLMPLKFNLMSNTRLSNDLAILYVDRDINLNHPYVNTACLPSC